MPTTIERQMTRVVLDLDMTRASVDISTLVRAWLKVAGRVYAARCTSVTWTTHDAADVGAVGQSVSETTA